MSCAMLRRTILPGATDEGRRYRGISNMLQSRSTSVADDFSMLPTVRVYYLALLYLEFIFIIINSPQSIFPNFMFFQNDSKLYHFIFSINTIFQNRMKRSASSASKENALKGCFSKNSCRQKRPYQEQIKLLCTQSLVPDYQARQSHPWNTPMPDFYKTFAHNNVTEFSRPESKQAFRKCLGRPETSKGVRPSQKNLRIWQPESKIGYHSQYIIDKKECEQAEPEPTCGASIEIIITQSNRKCGEKKLARSKFQTDLDDQFLQLFAN